mmetsp:Transcript_90369/g.227387  ORF Transcript_90369/g.227387 Transcript_90369/m.227387 type:complete len:242 (+) Transcript_90369:50-775(+)
MHHSCLSVHVNKHIPRETGRTRSVQDMTWGIQRRYHLCKVAAVALRRIPLPSAECSTYAPHCSSPQANNEHARRAAAMILKHLHCTPLHCNSAQLLRDHGDYLQRLQLRRRKGLAPLQAISTLAKKPTDTKRVRKNSACAEAACYPSDKIEPCRPSAWPIRPIAKCTAASPPHSGELLDRLPSIYSGWHAAGYPQSEMVISRLLTLLSFKRCLQTSRCPAFIFLAVKARQYPSLSWRRLQS